MTNGGAKTHAVPQKPVQTKQSQGTKAAKPAPAAPSQAARQ